MGSMGSMASVLAACLACVFLTACHTAPGGATATASDEWTRTYTLTPGGEVQITNRNGSITVTAADGDTVDVRAERTVKAPTEAAAKDLLPKVEIREDIRPDHVELQTAGVDGILINVSWTVHYHVRAPRTSVVRVRASNGDVDVGGFSGRVIATSANGGLTASALTGGAAGRTSRPTSPGLAAISSRYAPPTARCGRCSPLTRTRTSSRRPPTGESKLTA